ncbi:MAG: helix-turn-helix transcriptional regulator, partial [Rhodothermales bacterium]|nr:helix-turn-helix transcriptional regulator [Rhodothermales bacterium]
VTVTAKEAVFLQEVLAVIEDHLGDSTFSVDWLADEVGISRRQLERRIQETADRSPGELIRHLRIQRGTQLLRAHAGTVSEISYMVGFRSPSHFSRVYRDLTGQAPSEVRAEPD